jgi:hypothetical protein
MIRVVLAKLRGYRSCTRFAALFAGSVLLVAFIGSHVTTFATSGEATPISALLGGPNAWAAVCGLTRLLVVIPAFFVVQLVAAELELRVTRAQVIAGLERHDVVFAWTVLNALLAALAVIVAAVTVLLLGGAEARTGAALAKGAGALAGLFVYALAYLGIATFCAALLRRPVPALALLLGGQLALEPLVGLMLERYGLGKVEPYLPFETLKTLTPWPGGEPLALTSFTAAAVAWGVAAVLLTWARLVRADL